MLCRDISQITNKMCQIQHETLPSYIEFMQLKLNKLLKQIHYLNKHEDVLRTQKMIQLNFSWLW